MMQVYSYHQVMGVWWRWWNRSVPSAFVWSVSETLWSWAAGTYPGPQQEIWKQELSKVLCCLGVIPEDVVKKSLASIHLVAFRFRVVVHW